MCGIGPLQIVRRFATDPRIKVALLSVTAAGTGLDFSAASHVVFAELPHEVRDCNLELRQLLLYQQGLTGPVLGLLGRPTICFVMRTAVLDSQHFAR